MEVSEKYIRQCSLTLGQFDSESVNILVTLFHHQNACSQFTCLSNNLKEKFENLLTTKTDNDGERSNDTPLTRIELAIMIHFKQKYLSEPFIDNDNNQLKLNMKFSIEDELNLAYCFLLAQIDDRVSEDLLSNLRFLLKIEQDVKSLFDVYEKLGENFPKFFSSLLQCKYFQENLVIAHQLIEKFQLFIKRYEDFIRIFAQNYKVLLPDNPNCIQTDAILNQNDTQEISSFMSKVVTTSRDRAKPSISAPVEQPSKISLTRSTNQPLISSNVPRKALCVIINITKFLSSESMYTSERAGSGKDVDLIKLVFGKLNFTVLECRIDFKKNDLDQALDYIDKKENFGDFDCLVMFIMSHGLLHSFFTADSKEIIIRDIVKRYSDSSPKTIWNGKCRIFFIQACRSLWPEQNNQPHNREEVKQNDLSPRMLVAYSCSANEASKRSPTHGSIFIQILCIMLVRYSHYYQIQTILEWTAKFVIKGDEYRNVYQIKKISVQTPEYIERDFNLNFRFSADSLIDKYRSFSYEEKVVLYSPLGLWRELYDLVFFKNISEHEE